MAETDEFVARPAPAKHTLTSVGIGLMFCGFVLLAVGFLGFDYKLPAYATPLDIEEAANQFKLQLLSYWAGEHLLAAGFFTWLGGAVIDALRHPKHY